MNRADRPTGPRVFVVRFSHGYRHLYYSIIYYYYFFFFTEIIMMFFLPILLLSSSLLLLLFGSRGAYTVRVHTPIYRRHVRVSV